MWDNGPDMAYSEGTLTLVSDNPEEFVTNYSGKMDSLRLKDTKMEAFLRSEVRDTKHIIIASNVYRVDFKKYLRYVPTFCNVEQEEDTISFTAQFDDRIPNKLRQLLIEKLTTEDNM